MIKTYLILQGLNSDNARLLQYASSLGEAKHVLTLGYNHRDDTFILMVKGTEYGQGRHIYTLELVNGKYKRNTKLARAA